MKEAVYCTLTADLHLMNSIFKRIGAIILALACILRCLPHPTTIPRTPQIVQYLTSGSYEHRVSARSGVAEITPRFNRSRQPVEKDSVEPEDRTTELTGPGCV